MGATLVGSDAELIERVQLEEQWRSVRGYEEIYEVSDKGTLVAIQGGNRWGAYAQRRVKSACRDKDGRLTVSLGRNGKFESVNLAKVVLEAFDSPQPEGHVPGYYDGNRSNVSVENLFWRRQNPRVLKGLKNNEQFEPLNLEGERWLPVVGLEDTYEVSDFGRVRSVERERQFGNQFRTVPAKIMKQYRRKKDKYVCVTFQVDGKDREKCVHRLVLRAFVGEPPIGPDGRRLDGCHNDDNKDHNRLGNLRYDTRKNNIADAFKNGARGLSTMLKISEAHTGLSDGQVLTIYRRYLKGVGGRGPRSHPGNVKQLAMEFGVSTTLVHGIGNGTNIRIRALLENQA